MSVVSSVVPFIIFIVVVLGLLAFSARARRRQAAVQAERSASIEVGSEVMTTSGLYGTVVARNEDETVMMSIAPGVEVKWAVAALRDMDSLPAQYRQDAAEPDDSGEPSPRIGLDKRLGPSGDAGGPGRQS
jgi:preprotein translocase subunit YajC